MASPEIILFGNPALRETSSPVTVFHKKLHRKIDTIKKILFEHGGGAALAAPQIALLKRITVINYMGEYFECINPSILEQSGKTIDYEGCLSLPGYTGRVERAKTVTVSFQDRNGKERVITRSDEMARCFQHEIDHLNGILYIDRMTDEFLINIDNNTKLPVNEILSLAPVRNMT